MNYKDEIINIYMRFIREVEGIRKCNHENIVKFIRALRDVKGDLYIIMEKCDIDLWHKIKNSIEEKVPIKERQLVNILKQIA